MTIQLLVFNHNSWSHQTEDLTITPPFNIYLNSLSLTMFYVVLLHLLLCSWRSPSQTPILLRLLHYYYHCLLLLLLLHAFSISGSTCQILEIVCKCDALCITFNNIYLPISLCKGKHSCTFRPISHVINYGHLQLTYHAFSLPLATKSISKLCVEAVQLLDDTFSCDY